MIYPQEGYINFRNIQVMTFDMINHLATTLGNPSLNKI